MHRRLHVACLLVIALWLLGTRQALAQPRWLTVRPEVVLALEPAGLSYNHLDGGSGSTAVNVGGSLDLWLSMFSVGVDGWGSVALSDVESAYVGGHAGIGFGSRHVRFDMLGEAGGHWLSSLASPTGGQAEPIGAWLPYLGVAPTLTVRMRLRNVGLLIRVQMQTLFDVGRTAPLVEKDPLTPLPLGGYSVGWLAGLGIAF